MFTPDILPHVGRYCEVTARDARYFGELIRLSTALFLVRPTRPSTFAPQTVEAADIREIVDLADPHL